MKTTNDNNGTPPNQGILLTVYINFLLHVALLKCDKSLLTEQLKLEIEELKQSVQHQTIQLLEIYPLKHHRILGKMYGMLNKP